MKALHLILLFTIIILLSSCDKENNEINGSFGLEVNESINLTDNTTNLQLKLVSIQDSRCPSDAVCIRAGNAIVKLRVTESSGSAVETELCLGECGTTFNRQDTSIVSIRNTRISIILENVNPYPSTGNSKVSKKALFKLQKL